MNIICRYIDHFSCDKKDLGIFYKEKPYIEETNSILSTCHRLEAYSVVNNETLPQFEISGYVSKQIQGIDNIGIRLARIASGVESVILGEPFVYNQVKNAFKKNETNPILFEIVQNSLNVAKIVRDKFNFYSEMDYSDIAINFLDSKLPVVMIGSGMLSTAIIEKLKCSPTIVTRNPKSTRKKFKDINVCKIANVPKIPFQCIIATTHTDKYSIEVSEFLNDSDCSLVIDMSAIPFLIKNKISNKFNYITMYDEIFEKEIELSNKNLRHKIPVVKNMIRELIIESIL